MVSERPTVLRSRLASNEMGPDAPLRVVLRRLFFTCDWRYDGKRGYSTLAEAQACYAGRGEHAGMLVLLGAPVRQ